MNNSQRPKEWPLRLAFHHRKILLLLDAYATRELGQLERKMVEEHVAVCSECQHMLSTLSQVRAHLSRLPDYMETHYPMEKNIPPEDVDVSSELAERVLTEISERKGKLMKREFLTSALQGRQTGMKLHKGRSQIPFYSLTAAILCILVLTGGFLMTSIFGHYSPSSRKAIPFSPVWELQQGQLLAQTQEGVFGIQYVDITSREIRIFYAFHLNKASSVGVEAFSALPSTPKDLTKLAATTQSFGEVGTFTVGVIHIPRQNRVGQTLKLQMSVIGKNSPIWQLLPLRQLRSDPTTLHTLSPRQTTFSEVTWYGPVTEHRVAFFKSAATHQHGSDAYVFIRLDNPVTITSITRMEYLALAGSKNIL